MTCFQQHVEKSLAEIANSHETCSYTFSYLILFTIVIFFAGSRHCLPRPWWLQPQLPNKNHEPQIGRLDVSHHGVVLFQHPGLQRSEQTVRWKEGELGEFATVTWPARLCLMSKYGRYFSHQLNMLAWGTAWITSTCQLYLVSQNFRVPPSFIL